ncbi:hypothetical protein E4U41_004778 [Claviceps citrina]|nr:hypothetical protein E4U41_004778 [Claviceps citrina]
MSEDCLADSSFGDPNAQPPTPKQTPKSTPFPSPVFETPKPYPGSFTDAGGLTPRFAEEYSVFNATPGNLRGTQAVFPDSAAVVGSVTSSVGLGQGHKRLLSTESLAVQVAAHVGHYSPGSTAPLPRVESGPRQSSSSDPSTAQQISSPSSSALGPSLVKTPTSSKKARRRIPTDAEPTQIISPPPTARKGERKLAPKPSMQNGQAFGLADFADSSQQDMTTAFMANVGDMFGYSMTGPATAQPNFWNPSLSMGMDLNFTTSAHHLFQPPTSSNHRHTGSFDWNTEIQLFQDPSVPPSSNHRETLQPSGLPRTLVPKSYLSMPLSHSIGGHSLPAAAHPATNTTTTDDPFAVTNAGDAVDPGLLFSRPQSAAMDADLGRLAQSGSAEAAIIARSGRAQASSDVCRSGSSREPRANARGPDRAIASSPVKSLGRSGLGRSLSETRGKKKPVRRGSLPLLAPAAVRPASGAGLSVCGSTGRLSGRVSPSKGQPRLNSLESIPETPSRPRPRTSVRLFIDSHGRARTETTLSGGSALMARCRSSQDVAFGRGYCSSVDGDESEDTDDEPIIIPSRNNSFAASFALPDPRKPVGSIFHSSTRSLSERSSSNSANEGESEAETVVDEKPGKVGDATSELRKVVKDRQERCVRLGASRCQRSILTANLGSFAGGIISPTSLTVSSSGPDSHTVRCVCNSSKTDEGGGFMVLCESCEMWLHGQCINITRRTMPSVYICGFCADMPNMGRRWTLRDGEGDNALGIGTTSSPLAKKSFRSCR